MRKHQSKPKSIIKPLKGASVSNIKSQPESSALSGKSTKFKGFKISTSTTVKHQPSTRKTPSKFDNSQLDDDAPKRMLIVDAQGDEILGIDEHNAKNPPKLVIPSKQNTNWITVAEERRKAPNPKATVLGSVAPAEKYGLQIPSSSSSSLSRKLNEHKTPNTNSETSLSTKTNGLSLREQAIGELENRVAANNGLVIALADSVREQKAYHEDIVACADDVTDDSYERIPIEDFGAAMLRGMGWSDGDGTKSKYKRHINAPDTLSKSRPSLLGLGAKPRPEDSLPEKRQRIKKY